MFHEVRMNSYSIDAIFEEDRGAFSQPVVLDLFRASLGQKKRPLVLK